MDLHPDPIAVAAKAAAACDRVGIRYAIIGGLAASVHGITRFTADADLVIELAKEDVERRDRLLAALLEEGFRVGVDAVKRRLARGPRFITTYLGLTRLDLMLKRPDAFWQEALEHRCSLMQDGRELWFASPEDIVALKLVAARPRDLQDVRNVLITQGAAIDRERLRGLVARYAVSAGRPELPEDLQRHLADIDRLLEQERWS